FRRGGGGRAGAQPLRGGTGGGRGRRTGGRLRARRDQLGDGPARGRTGSGTDRLRDGPAQGRTGSGTDRTGDGPDRSRAGHVGHTGRGFGTGGRSGPASDGHQAALESPPSPSPPHQGRALHSASSVPAQAWSGGVP